MKNFDTRVYNISDFLEWDAAKLLDLSPQFQRRSVWTEKAKSYLIDTIVRGKPIPKVLLTQTLTLGRNVRTVVDGQQRIRTILGYINGDFTISRAHHRELAGKKFDSLPDELKSEFLQYEIGVDMLFDLSFEDTLDTFARLNSYSVKLNSQELLNAQYLGYFKQAAYRLGFGYVRYWIESEILSEKQVARMSEAELASDLLMTIIGGVQAPRAIPSYYRKYDDDERPVEVAEEIFNQTMSWVGEIYSPNDIKDTIYERVTLFYALFTMVAHGIHGIPGMEDVPRPNLTLGNLGQVRSVLDEISARVSAVAAKEADPPTVAYREFIAASSRATADAKSRRLRTEFICNLVVEALE